MSGELLDRRERKIFDVMLYSEAQNENHDSKVTVNHFITRLKCLPIISGQLSLCAAQMIYVERGAE